MSVLPFVLLAICAIILGFRLSSFFDRQGGSKWDQIALVIIMFALLLLAAGAPRLFGDLLVMFR